MSFLFFLMIVCLAVGWGYSSNETKKLKRRLSEMQVSVTHLYQRMQALETKIKSAERNEREASGGQPVPASEREGGEELEGIRIDPEVEPVQETETAHQKESVSSEPPPQAASIGTSPDWPPSEQEPASVEAPGRFSRRSRLEWELLIGGKWLNYIGAVALVIGLGFFVKYAFENNWINEVVRILAGGAAGFLLLWGGARSSKKGLPVFAQGLIGAGIAILYVSSFASFNFYHLVSLEVAFLFMSLVTLLAFQQALRYNALAISVIGWIGGFLTPFLLGSERGSTLGLFTYLAFLTLGMLLLVSKKENWVILYYLTLSAVYLTVLSWMAFKDEPSELLLQSFFFCLFWALFFAYEVYSSLRPAKWPMANTIAAGFHLFFFFLGWNLLFLPKHEDWLGPLFLLAGLVYLAPLILLHRRQKLSLVSREEVLRYGFSFLILLTLANAYQWDQFHLIYAWTVEAWLLAWWGGRRMIRHVCGFSVILYAITSLALIAFSAQYQPEEETWLPLFNFHGLAYIGLSAAMGTSALLFKRWNTKLAGLTVQFLHNGWALLFFLFLTGEINFYFHHALMNAGPALRESIGYNRYLICALVWMAYSLFVAWVAFRERIRSLVATGWIFLGLGVTTAAAMGMAYGPVDQFIPVYNLRFIVFVIAAGIIYVHLRWWRMYGHGLNLKAMPVVMVVAMAVLLFELITLEVGDYYDQQLLSADGPMAQMIRFTKYMVLILGWLAYSLFFAWMGFSQRLQALVYVAWGVLGIGMLTAIWQGFSYPALDRFVPVFNLRFFTLLVAAGALIIHFTLWKKQAEAPGKKVLPLLFTIVITGLLFELVTAEVSDVFERIRYLADQSDVRLLHRLDNQKQMSLSIAWLIYSLILMGVGIWRKQSTLRLIAIALFGLSILKIFLFDLSFLGTLYRIFSFIGLGVILLIVSYLYQRYKHWFNQAA